MLVWFLFLCLWYSFATYFNTASGIGLSSDVIVPFLPCLFLSPSTTLPFVGKPILNPLGFGFIKEPKSLTNDWVKTGATLLANAPPYFFFTSAYSGLYFPPSHLSPYTL